VAAAAAVLVVAAGAVVAAVVSSSPPIGTRSAFVAGTPEAGAAVGLDVTVYSPATTPAVLLAQGFGGSKTDLDSEALSRWRLPSAHPSGRGDRLRSSTVNGERCGSPPELRAPAAAAPDASRRARLTRRLGRS
jgi:hypothetical protein